MPSSPIGPCSSGQHDDRAGGLVEGGEGVEGRALDEQRLGEGVGAGGQRLDGGLGLHPLAAAGDADRHDVVAVGVGGGEHVAGRDPGDVVLGGLAAEQHDQADAAGAGTGGRGGRRRGGHRLRR